MKYKLTLAQLRTRCVNEAMQRSRERPTRKISIYAVYKGPRVAGYVWCEGETAPPHTPLSHHAHVATLLNGKEQH